MSTIIKTVKQYSYELDEEMLKELLFIANQYKNVKNYVYSRYSGINSILLLGKDRKIRDQWIKGYIRERVEYKCSLNDIKCTYINPAYTSKVCNICGSFGTRNGDTFNCPKCGKLHSDINASKNILNRKTDEEITLYTPYKKVKAILLDREKIS